jgi:hypothetical protein
MYILEKLLPKAQIFFDFFVRAKQKLHAKQNSPFNSVKKLKKATKINEQNKTLKHENISHCKT